MNLPLRQVVVDADHTTRTFWLHADDDADAANIALDVLNGELQVDRETGPGYLPPRRPVVVAIIAHTNLLGDPQ